MEYIKEDSENGASKSYMLVGNKKEGLCKIHIGSSLFSEFNYINDKIEGLFKGYYENGQLYDICNYINDKR